MSLVHTDPFAHYTGSQYADIYTDGPFGAALTIGPYGPDSRPGLRFAGDLADSVERLGLSTSGAVSIMQGHFRIGAAPASTNVIMAALLSGAIQCSLDINADRTLAVHRGFAGTKVQLGSNSTYVVPLNTHIHIGVKFTIANSGGSIVVHVWEDSDSAAQVVLNVTGVDTQDGASATWDGFNLGASNDTSTDWANFIVMDGSSSSLNDLLGPKEVWALWASTRETPTLNNWTLSAGSIVAELLSDITPDDNASYVSSSTLNQVQSVFVDAIPLPDRSILGAQLYLSAAKVSGSPTIASIAKQSGTTYVGSNVSPGSAYTYAMRPYSAMPDGTAFSTAAAFDALEWGAKLTTAGGAIRLTQLVVAVILDAAAGSMRNLLTGFTHEVMGDDNLLVGRENVVTGSIAEAHGTRTTVVATRSVGFGLDGAPHTLAENGTFKIWGKFEVEGEASLPGLTVGGLADGDKGDVTVSSSGATWTIDNDAVAYAKMQNVSAASKLLGRGDSGSGDVQEIALGSGLAMSGTTLDVTSGSTTGRLIGVQRITATGAYTYTPTSATASVVVELQGAGGGGAGVASAGASQVNLGGGGGSGAWIRVRLSSDFSGATGSVGAGGAGGAAGNNNGAAGGNTTFVTTGGSPVTYTAGGGGAGAFRGSFAPPITVTGGAGGTATNGDDQLNGSGGFPGIAPNQFVGWGGGGAASRYGPFTDSRAVQDAASSAGFNATGKGAGGSGAVSSNAGGNAAGGNGGNGIVIIWEYS